MADSRIPYVAPSISDSSFNCPHCNAIAHQSWYSVVVPTPTPGWLPVQNCSGLPQFGGTIPSTQRNSAIKNLYVSRCFNCTGVAIWIGHKLTYPDRGQAPLPNPDLSEEVRLDYEEAGKILGSSPRGAAALLRLAIQKLCKELGGKGKSIDDDIALLVRKGLDVRIQRALDIVRVIGNNAVHPGQVDLRDDQGTAERLFGLVNVIADRMITQPKDIDALYESLPESSREAIERRDGEAKS